MKVQYVPPNILNGRKGCVLLFLYSWNAASSPTEQLLIIPSRANNNCLPRIKFQNVSDRFIGDPGHRKEKGRTTLLWIKIWQLFVMENSPAK